MDKTPRGVRRFRFADDGYLRRAAAAFGATSQHAWVDVGDDMLDVRFGPWRLRTPISNIAGTEISGPYQWWKVAGPARLSLADRGVTFATTTRAGTCIRFHEPVAGIDPFGVIRHPGLTVTVDDPQALCDEIRARTGAGGTTP